MPEWDDRYYLEERYRGQSAGALPGAERLLRGQTAAAASPPDRDAAPLREAPGSRRVSPLADRAGSRRAPQARAARGARSARRDRNADDRDLARGQALRGDPHPRCRGPAGVANVRQGSSRSSAATASSPPGISSPSGTRSPTALLEQIRAAGCEVGLHGIKHDCKLFESRANFEARAAGDPSLSRRVGRRGLPLPGDPPQCRIGCRSSGLSTTARSPTPIRSSPRPGGCCSILPFFLDGPRRASDHPGPGSHAVGDPPPGLDRALDAEERLDHRQRRADQPDHPSRLPRYARPACACTRNTSTTWPPRRRLVSRFRGRLPPGGARVPACAASRTAKAPASRATAPSGPRSPGRGRPATALTLEPELNLRRFRWPANGS